MPLSARRFFKTPKGLLIIILSIVLLLGATSQDLRAVALGLACSIGGAGTVDALILRWRKKRWTLPDGAILTAAIVVMVLRAQEAWYVTTAVSVFSVLSKYAIRSRGANIFNPAALGMVASYYVFHTGESWWGALTDVAPILKLVMFGGGFYIAGRVNKLPLVLSFLGAYFGIFTLQAYMGDALAVAEIFHSPDAEAAFFFAFIILTDPPTSPTRYGHQMVFGAIAALVSYLFFTFAGVVYFLLAGVLAANVWEAIRRATPEDAIQGFSIKSNEGLLCSVPESSPSSSVPAPSLRPPR